MTEYEKALADVEDGTPDWVKGYYNPIEYPDPQPKETSTIDRDSRVSEKESQRIEFKTSISKQSVSIDHSIQVKKSVSPGILLVPGQQKNIRYI